MQREIIDHPQGSPEWLSMRLTGGGASEASAMLELSPYVTRAELLAQKATGLAREYSEWFETHVLAKGHEVEAKARPIAESLLEGEDLYPVTMRMGRLIASCDGLTMDGKIAWENKQWNGEDADMVSAGFLPPKHLPQCQQILYVTGAERLLFTISDGTEENTVWVWVHPNSDWAEKLEAGWAQFFAEVDSWTPPESAPAKAIGKTMDSLPALRVLVKGEVQESNIDAWADIARTVLRSINRNLNTDQDFADAEKAVKWCADQELALKAAKQHALSQTETIDKLFKTIDAIIEETAAIRIEQDKLVTRRKTERKVELVGETVAEWRTFISELNSAAAPYVLPAIATDFPAQIKNKRNFDSMSVALGAELKRAKEAATVAAGLVATNRKTIDDASEYAFLFNDAASLVHREPDFVTLTVVARVKEHQAERARKAEEAAEAAREKIRAEERAKAEAEAAAKAKAEREAAEARAQAERDEQARIAAAELAERQEREAKAVDDRRRQDEEARQERERAEADLKSLDEQKRPGGPPNSDPVIWDDEPTPAGRAVESVYSVGVSTVEYAATNMVFERPNSAPQAATEAPTLNLGEISRRWGQRMDSTFIRVELGIEPRDTVKGSVLFYESDWRRILRALVSRANRLTDDCDRAAAD